MNVQSIEIGASRDGNIRKVEQLSFDQNSAIGGVIKFDQAADFWIGGTALEPGHRLGAIFLQKMKKGEPGSWFWIGHNSYFPYYGFSVVYEGVAK